MTWHSDATSLPTAGLKCARVWKPPCGANGRGTPAWGAARGFGRRLGPGCPLLRTPRGSPSSLLLLPPPVSLRFQFPTVKLRFSFCSDSVLLWRFGKKCEFRLLVGAPLEAGLGPDPGGRRAR